MNRSSSNHSALLALVVLILVWGYSWIVMKEVMHYAGPFQFAALRYAGGALVLLVLMALRRQSLRPPALGLTILVGLCQTAGFQALSQWALVGGGAGHVSVLSYTMPFWVVLLAWWLLRERPGPRQWAGLVLAAVGLVCVLQPWEGLGDLHSAFLAIGGGFFWGLGTVLAKRMFERHAPSPLAFTTWQMLFGAVALGVVALAVPSQPIVWNVAFVAGLAYSVVLASSLAWVLWLFVIQRLTATVAGLSSLAVPVTAVLMAWAILHERPNTAESIGIVLIMLGLATVSGVGRRHKRVVPAQ